MCLIELQPWGNDVVLGRDDNGAHGGHRAWLSLSSLSRLCLGIFVLDSVWKQAAGSSCHVWHQNTGIGEGVEQDLGNPSCPLAPSAFGVSHVPLSSRGNTARIRGCRHKHGGTHGQDWAVHTSVIRVPEVGAPCLCDLCALGTHTPPLILWTLLQMLLQFLPVKSRVQSKEQAASRLHAQESISRCSAGACLCQGPFSFK